MLHAFIFFSDLRLWEIYSSGEHKLPSWEPSCAMLKQIDNIFCNQFTIKSRLSGIRALVAGSVLLYLFVKSNPENFHGYCLRRLYKAQGTIFTVCLTALSILQMSRGNYGLLAGIIAYYSIHYIFKRMDLSQYYQNKFFEIVEIAQNYIDIKNQIQQKGFFSKIELIIRVAGFCIHLASLSSSMLHKAVFFAHKLPIYKDCYKLNRKLLYLDAGWKNAQFPDSIQISTTLVGLWEKTSQLLEDDDWQLLMDDESWTSTYGETPLIDLASKTKENWITEGLKQIVERSPDIKNRLGVINEKILLSKKIAPKEQAYLLFQIGMNGYRCPERGWNTVEMILKDQNCALDFTLEQKIIGFIQNQLDLELKTTIQNMFKGKSVLNSDRDSYHNITSILKFFDIIDIPSQDPGLIRSMNTIGSFVCLNQDIIYEAISPLLQPEHILNILNRAVTNNRWKNSDDPESTITLLNELCERRKYTQPLFEPNTDQHDAFKQMKEVKRKPKYIFVKNTLRQLNVDISRRSYYSIYSEDKFIQSCKEINKSEQFYKNQYQLLCRSSPKKYVEGYSADEIEQTICLIYSDKTSKSINFDSQKAYNAAKSALGGGRQPPKFKFNETIALQLLTDLKIFIKN